MKKYVFVLLVWFVSVLLTAPVWAQTPTPAPNLTTSPAPELEATDSAQSTESATLVEKVVEKKPDITEPKSEIKGKLEKYLADNPPTAFSITNFLQHAIRAAVKQGVPANTIVVVLLFPLVASLIASSRHLVGVRGLGIFLPAVLSVVFVATGIVVGVLLFLTILIVATGARLVLRKMKMMYLPRMALLLWFVSLGVLSALFISPWLNLKALTTISIFPILLLVLLTEQFIDLQVGKSMREAVQLTFETVLLALACSLVINLEFLQKLVLLHPEAYILAIAFFDIFIGKYTGLRWLEYRKFKELLK